MLSIDPYPTKQLCWPGDNRTDSIISPVPMHYSDVIMSAMASQITGVLIVCSIACSGADKKNQTSASPAFVNEIHRWPLDSPHKGPITRKMFPFDDVVMEATREEKGWPQQSPKSVHISINTEAVHSLIYHPLCQFDINLKIMDSKHNTAGALCEQF